VNFTLRVDNVANESQKSPAVVVPPLVGRLWRVRGDRRRNKNKEMAQGARRMAQGNQTKRPDATEAAEAIRKYGR